MNTTTHLLQAAQELLAAPSPAPSPAPDAPAVTVNTTGLIKVLTSQFVPVLLVFLGIVFLSRAKSGNVSGVVTSSGIAIVALGFIAGAGTFFFAGDFLVDLIFAK